MATIQIGLEEYEAVVIVRITDKRGGARELKTSMNPLFALGLFGKHIVAGG
tara:strand:- start:234 stop:386 length:153 start_codon:yes stop_codon:yes gene_type:complete